MSRGIGPCSPQRTVPERWGYPFWEVVRDMAEQGLSRAQVGKALGYQSRRFLELLREHPEHDPFEPSNIVMGYLLDTGEGFRAALERMARENYSLAAASRVIGYRNPQDLRANMEARGIDLVFGRLDAISEYERKCGKPLATLLADMAERGYTKGQAAKEIGLASRQALSYQMKSRGINIAFKQPDAIAKYEKKSGKDLATALAEMAGKGYSGAAAARAVGMGSAPSLAYQMRVRGIDVRFDLYRPSKRDHPWKKASEASYQRRKSMSG